MTSQPEPLLAVRKIQKAWDTPLVKIVQGEMLEMVSLRDKARLTAAATRESGAWMNALPIPSLGNLLDDSTLQISVALRLGAEVCRPHVCQCGQQVDPAGNHGLSCRRSAGQSSLNSSLNKVVKSALISGGVQAIRNLQDWIGIVVCSRTG